MEPDKKKKKKLSLSAQIMIAMGLGIVAGIFSVTIMEGTLCFIVRDHRRAQFATREAVKSIPKIKIDIPLLADYFFPKLKAYLPQADIIEVDSIEEYFKTNQHQLDALLMEAEGGSAWTLRYPQFKGVVRYSFFTNHAKPDSASILIY
jgi:hypothetical protein